MVVKSIFHTNFEFKKQMRIAKHFVIFKTLPLFSYSHKQYLSPFSIHYHVQIHPGIYIPFIQIILQTYMAKRNLQ